MFNEAGQILHGVVFRGGGGKGGGGGGGGMTTAPQTYTDPVNGMTFGGQDQLNAEILQRQQNDATTAAAAKAQADATAAANEGTFQGNKQQAYNDAMQSVMQTFKGQGVDPTNYMGYITPQLQQASNSIPDLSANPSAYFPTSLGQQILNQATGDRRTQLMNTINSTFNPTYSSTMLPDSILTDPVNSILNNQFDPLGSQLTNALNRGTLNQAGYTAAQAKMAQDRTAAQSQLQSLGQTILGTDRTGLDTLAGGARSDVANMTLGQNIDPSQYFSQGSSQAANDISGFPGALQNAAGNVTFADIQDLLNAGGAVQGATNPTATNPLGGGTGAVGAGGTDPSAIAAAQDASKRGLGNTGAF